MIASIILPIYNRKYFISRCLEALLNQTMQDYEIIVIDDGSTDGTQENLSFSSKGCLSKKDRRKAMLQLEASLT